MYACILSMYIYIKKKKIRLHIIHSSVSTVVVIVVVVVVEEIVVKAVHS